MQKNKQLQEIEATLSRARRLLQEDAKREQRYQNLMATIAHIREHNIRLISNEALSKDEIAERDRDLAQCFNQLESARQFSADHLAASKADQQKRAARPVKMRGFMI